jgi:hypothetical protein
MPTQVQIPDFGNVEFPDEMDPTQIKRVIREKIYDLPTLPEMPEYNEDTYRTRRTQADDYLKASAADLAQRGQSFNQAVQQIKSGQATASEDDIRRASQALRLANARHEMALQDYAEVQKDPAPFLGSFRASGEAAILNTAAAIPDAARALFPPIGEPAKPERSNEYAHLIGERERLKTHLANGDLPEDWSLTVGSEDNREYSPQRQADARLTELSRQISDIERGPRSETLGGRLRAAAQDIPAELNVNPNATNAMAQIGRGTGSAVPILASGMAGGLPGALAQAAGSSYEGAYGSTEKALRAQGETDDSKIHEEASKVASAQAVAQVPQLAAYMIGGQLSAAAIARYLPNAGAAMRGITTAAASTGLNAGVSAVLGHYSGERGRNWIEQLTQDALFGIHAGVSEGLRNIPAERAAPEAIQESVPESVPESAPEPVASPKAEPAQEPAQEAAPTPPAEEPKAPSIQDIVPAIKVGDEVIQGKPGETHKEILDRFVAENPEQAADALMDFDTKENPNFFVGPDEQPISRSELKDQFGVSDSQGLRDLQEQQRNLGPGAANIEEQFGPQFTTSNKEATVNEERQAMGFDPVIKEARISNAESIDRARDILDADPNRAEQIIERLQANPHERTISLEDSAVMLVQKAQLVSQRDAAAERAFNPNATDAERTDNLEQFSYYEKKIGDMDQAAQNARSVWGRFGQLWQRTMRNDYSLVAMESRARVAKGEALTPEESAKIKQQSERIADLEKQLAAHTEASATADSLKGVDAAITAAQKANPLNPQVLSLADRIVAKLDTLAADALKRFRQKTGQLGSAPDVSMIADVAVYGAAKIAKGFIKFADWSAEMIKDMGESVRPFLKDAFPQADEFLNKTISGVAGKKRTETKKAIAVKSDLPAKQASIGTAISEAKANGETLSGIRRYVTKLVENLVRQGITNRDKVVDSIHEVLKQSFPETTRRQAMDLISGYGEFSPLDNDAVKAQTRDIRGQLQQVAKLEDIQAKEPLKKTGVERRKPSDEERRLIREVNEAKKKYGVVTTDPATQLKSALDAAKTRMRNQIKDLTFQIETGEKPKAGEPPPTDEDLDSLRGLRDRVKQTLRDLEGDPKLTDEQRAKVATRSIERRISELKQRVQAGDASRKTSKPISTPPLEALRAERDALQAHVDEIRAADSQAAEERKFDAAMKAADELEKKLASGDIGTKAKIQGADSELVAEAKQRLKGLRETLSQAKANSPEAIAGKLDAAKRSVEDSISELDRRIQDEDFTTSKKSLPTSPELEALRAQRDAMRQLFNKLKQATVPKLSAEQVALKALKSRIASRNAELLRRIADKDFTPNKRVPLDFSKDTEAVKLKAESDRLRKEFEKQRFEFEQAQRSKVRKTWDFIKESAAASRSLITSADISAPFRQGGFLLIGDLVTNPVKAGKQIGSMLHQLASEKAYDKAQASLSLRPNADLYQKSGLYFSDLDSKLSAREESMRGNLAEKIPVAGRIVRASNRAYTGFLNRQRADAFDAMVEAFGGKDSITPNEAKIIANAVNAFTGRGSALGMEKAGAVAARYFFSPRNLASRFQVLLGQPIFGEVRAGAALKARAVVAKQYAKFALGLAAIYGLASLAGAKISKDPKSSEFGKIRFGDTRIDPLAGLQQQIVILDRTLTGQQTVGGQQKPVDSDVYYRYIRSKLAPLPGAALDLRTGKNVVGDKVTPASALESLTVPMAYQDMGKIYKENGAVRGTILEMLNLMGMGLQNYRK